MESWSAGGRCYSVPTASAGPLEPASSLLPVYTSVHHSTTTTAPWWTIKRTFELKKRWKYSFGQAWENQLPRLQLSWTLGNQLFAGTGPPSHCPGAGCSRGTTKMQDEYLQKYVLKYPQKTAMELIQKVRGFDSKSARFVQDRHKRVLKIPSRSAAKKPLLTKKMMKKRLGFAK